MQKIGMAILVGGLALGIVGCLGQVIPADSQQPATGTGGNNNTLPTPMGNGGTPTGNGGSGSPDLATSSSGGTPDLGTTTNSACIPPATGAADGMHNAGLACLSCHNGSGATKFYAAGTIYNGGVGAGGITIEITDSTGVKVDLVSATGPTGATGNFHTTTALTPPLTVRATSCPANQVMPGSAGSGDCNSCHGANNQIHLP